MIYPDFLSNMKFLNLFLNFLLLGARLSGKEKSCFLTQKKVYWYLFSAFGKGNDHFLLQRLKEVYIFLHELMNTLFISMFTKRVTLVNDVHKTGNFSK